MKKSFVVLLCMCFLLSGCFWNKVSMSKDANKESSTDTINFDYEYSVNCVTDLVRKGNKSNGYEIHFYFDKDKNLTGDVRYFFFTFYDNISDINLDEAMNTIDNAFCSQKNSYKFNYYDCITKNNYNDITSTMYIDSRDFPLTKGMNMDQILQKGNAGLFGKNMKCRE